MVPVRVVRALAARARRIGAQSYFAAIEPPIGERAPINTALWPPQRVGCAGARICFRVRVDLVPQPPRKRTPIRRQPPHVDWIGNVLPPRNDAAACRAELSCLVARFARLVRFHRSDRLVGLLFCLVEPVVRSFAVIGGAALAFLGLFRVGLPAILLFLRKSLISERS